MTTLKTLIFLTSVILSFQAFGQSLTCLNKDMKVAPPVPERTTTNPDGTVVDTQVWISWKEQAGTPAQVLATQSLACCANLRMNPSTRVCTDDSMVDSTLVKCTAAADCAGDLGCFPMREDDMFKLDDNSSDAQVAAMAAKQEEFERQQGGVDQVPVGAICTRNMDCESYNCKRTAGTFFARCENAEKICRLGALNEIAPGKVKCEDPLQKDPLEKCYDPSKPVFKGALGVLNVVTTDPKTCQFELTPTAPGATPPDVRPAIDLAIGTSRGLEWLFSTTTHTRDCMEVVDYLRDALKAQIEIRKKILKDYSLNTKVVEEHFAIVNSAQKDDMSPILTLCGDTTTKHDVALRRATGLDYLCYMKKRNEVFTVYEQDMLKWTSEVNKIIETYKNDVFNYAEDSKSWTIAGRNLTYESTRLHCRHYYINLGFGVKLAFKKIKRRWDQKYRVAKNAKFNEVLNRPGVSNYLSYIGNERTVDLMRKGYYLDPVMPGGDNSFRFQSFGYGGDHERTLPGGEMAAMHASYHRTLATFLKGLRVDVAEEDFISEPEMPSSYEYRGCLNKVDSAECAPFKKYVEKLQDTAFAQFLAYSKHTRSKYTSYYKSDATPRKQLWNRYTTDLVNLQNYYTALGTLRNNQNACIDKVIAHLQGGDFQGDQMGIGEGAGNYYNPTDNNYQTGSGPKVTTKPLIKTDQNIMPYQISLSVYNKAMKTGGNKDSISSSSGGGSASVSAAGAGSLAARNQEIADANRSAAAAGINVAKEEAELRNSLKPKSAGGAGANAGGGSANSSAASSSGATGNKATLDADADADGKSGADTAASGASGAGGKGASAVGAGMPGIIGGAGSGSATATDAGGSKEDATGMSDEEKDNMAANYDRSKNKYKPSEEDSLFQVVSKTYVRNLEKILTRKKKLDENSASEPSSPSTP